LHLFGLLSSYSSLIACETVSIGADATFSGMPVSCTVLKMNASGHSKTLSLIFWCTTLYTASSEGTWTVTSRSSIQCYHVEERIFFSYTFHSLFTYHKIDLVISEREIWPKRNTSDLYSWGTFSNTGQTTGYLDRNFSVFLIFISASAKIAFCSFIWDGRFLIANNLLPYNLSGDRGSIVVEVLCYKSEGRWFSSRLCHWNFSLT